MNNFDNGIEIASFNKDQTKMTINLDNISNLHKEYCKLKKEKEQLETSITTKDNELKQLKDELWQLKTSRDEAIETIDKMIHTGYQDGLNYYWATKTQSEFGIRGKIIKQILERGKE